MKAIEVMRQNDGQVTTNYYSHLIGLGAIGRVAVALFRAQKRSIRAKQYRKGRYRRAAYDVKQWSMNQLCHELSVHSQELGITYGWKPDPKTPFGDQPSHVLYVDLPNIGQVSFHSPNRGLGPEYAGDWDQQHASEARVCMFCDRIVAAAEKGTAA